MWAPPFPEMSPSSPGAAVSFLGAGRAHDRRTLGPFSSGWVFRPLSPRPGMEIAGWRELGPGLHVWPGFLRLVGTAAWEERR